MTLSECIEAIDELRRELIKLKAAASTGAFPLPEHHENSAFSPGAGNKKSECPLKIAEAASRIRQEVRNVANGLPAETAIKIQDVADHLAVEDGHWCDRDMPHWLLKTWPTASASLRWTAAL